MSLIRCSERLPEFIHSAPDNGMTSARRCSDPVLAFFLSDGYWSAVQCWCGVKEDADWGKAPEGVPFWCDAEDMLAIHGQANAPIYWMPLPEKP